MAEPEPDRPTPQPKKMSDLKLRVISAVILGPLVLGIAYWGGAAFAVLILIAAGLFLREWFSMTGTRDATASAVAGYLALALSGVAFYLGHAEATLALIAGGAVAAYILSGFNVSGRWAGEGVFYSGLSLYALLAARSGNDGHVFLLFLLMVVWATDICAYFSGRAIGGPKLWPKVSPKKTWSGAMGGLLFAILFGTGLVAAFGQENLMGWAALAALLSVVSQAGDLLESAVKRRFDVKDSSNLIPGHGGIMDRVDGLVAAAIAAAFLGLVLGGTLADPISGYALR